MNTNKKYDAVKQNKAIQNSDKSATFDALRSAENNKSDKKSNKNQ